MYREFEENEFVYFEKLKQDGHNYEEKVVAKIIKYKHPNYHIEWQSLSLIKTFTT